MEEYQPNPNDNSSQGMGDNASGPHYPKSVVFGVILFSILSLVLVFWQMREHFTLQIPQLVSSPSGSVERISLLDQEDEQLKGQDSDLDGLSDYQELRVYGSSPFISDSDSDGIPDAVEVSNGTDPNCPEGQQCFGADTSLDTGTEITAPNQEQAELEQIVNDPAEIRRLLIEGGVDPALIAGTDDQSLQILAQESLTKLNDPSDDLQALITSLDETNVRGFFTTLGLSQEEIAEFTNEQLLQIVQGIINEQLGGAPFQGFE